MNPRGLDYNRQVIEYIRKNLRKGYTAESLKWALINQGHSKFEIEKAMKKLEEEMAHKAPVLKTKPEIKYERISSFPTTGELEKTKTKSLWKRLFRS